MPDAGCYLSQTLPVFENFVTSRSIVLFGISFLAYALLNASQGTENDFYVK
jgi:hypothetical protein